MEPLDFNANLKEESARPTGVRYGLILGLVSTVLSVVFIMTNTIDFSGTKSNMLSTIISWGVSIFFFYKAISTYKEELNGYITLGKSIVVSMWVGVVSSVISGLFMFIYFKFIDPTFIDKTLDIMRANLEEKGMDTNQIDTAMSMTSMFLTPVSMSLFTILGGVFMGLFLGLVLGLILRKDPPTFE